MKQINWDGLWLAGANASAHTDTHTHTLFVCFILLFRNNIWCYKVINDKKIVRDSYKQPAYSVSCDLWPSLEYQSIKTPIPKGLREKKWGKPVLFQMHNTACPSRTTSSWMGHLRSSRDQSTNSNPFLTPVTFPWLQYMGSSWSTLRLPYLKPRN